MLPRKNRLSRKDFPSTSGGGVRAFSLYFSAVFYKSTKTIQKLSRASVVVSKKTAKTAVIRNLLRRRFYEIISLYLETLVSPTTIVIYPKAGVQKIKFPELKVEVEKALIGAKLLK